MDKKIAMRAGLRRTVPTTIWAFCILLLTLLMRETEGDFANGILFFMSDFLNLPVFILFILVLIPAFLWGGRAGMEILIYGRKPAAVAIKYALISILVVAIPVLLFAINSPRINDEFRRQFQVTVLVISVPAELGIWFTSAWRIKSSFPSR